MSRNPRILLTLVIAAIAVATTVIGVRLWTVHEQTSDWALWPREVPSKVQFAGRDYTCGPVARAGTLDGLTLQGHTAGAGDIYARPSASSPSLSIAVRANGGIYICDLLGGP
jgi:hypothetical protein